MVIGQLMVTGPNSPEVTQLTSPPLAAWLIAYAKVVHAVAGVEQVPEPATPLKATQTRD
jgi:hypothetical protein